MLGYFSWRRTAETLSAQALKALALVRSQKVEESLVLCDEVLESKPTNEAVLTAMMHVLRGLGRRASDSYIRQLSHTMNVSSRYRLDHYVRRSLQITTCE